MQRVSNTVVNADSVLRHVRVLVVDESVVVRKALSVLLESDAGIEVAGVAATASIALQKIVQLAPDVVLVDATRAAGEGSEAGRRIRESFPDQPLLVLVADGAGAESAVWLEAAPSGPRERLVRPVDLANATGFAGRLNERVHALVCRVRGPKGAVSGPDGGERPPTASTTPLDTIPAIAIGSSTGGPNALATLFAGLPKDLAAPIFIVQHMPPMFTRLLAERLQQTSGFRVGEAVHGEEVEAGRVYIAPGDYHMAVARAPRAVMRGGGTVVQIRLNQGAHESSCRPAVDVLFRSMASVYGRGTIAAVLTGMGTDGTRGAQQIAAAGGVVIVQDAETCVVPSMPMSVAAAIGVDGVYPIDRIADELAARVLRHVKR